jgi:hypothetical protein
MVYGKSAVSEFKTYANGKGAEYLEQSKIPGPQTRSPSFRVPRAGIEPDRLQSGLQGDPGAEHSA